MAELITAVVLLTGGTEISDAQAAFERRGFQTEAVVGGSLLITAKPDVFQSVFSAEILQGEAGQFVRDGDSISRGMPKAKMPAELQNMVEAVEFEEPSDFGPSNF